MAEETDHDLNDSFEGGDIPWDHTGDMAKLMDILQYISVDGSTVYPPTLKADAPQEANDVIRQTDLSPYAERVGDDLSPTHVRPNGQPYVDVTSDEFGIEPGEWYSGWDGSTDHTDALQAAIDAARYDNTHSMAYFPGGEYYVSDPLVLDGPCAFKGAGTRTTRIVATEPMNAIFQNEDSSSREEHVYAGWFELACNGNADYAFDLDNIQRWGLEWLHCQGASQAAIRSDQAWLGEAQFIGTPNCYNGVELGTGNNAVKFTTSWLGYNDNLSVVCPSSGGGGIQLIFDNCQFEGTRAFDMTDVNVNIFFNNAYFEYEGDVPMVQFDNVKYALFDGGSFAGYEAKFIDEVDSDVRFDGFVLRDYRGDSEKMSLRGKPNDINVSFRDGVIELTPNQIRYMSQSRLVNHHFPSDEGVLNTDSDGDSVADGWFLADNSGSANAIMAGAGVVVDDDVQRVELGQYDSLRNSFSSPLDPGEYTVSIIYRVHNGNGRDPEVGIMDSDDNVTPIRYDSNNDRVSLPHSNDSVWHITNLHLTVESGDDVAGLWPAWTRNSGSGTLNMDVAAAQVFDGEYHVGQITPYDVTM